MKLNLTKREMCQLLSKAVGFNVNDFKVTKTNNLGEVLSTKFRLAVEGFNYKTNEKIAAIKALREISEDVPDPLPGYPERTKKEIGLAHAKWAVENWDKWIAFVCLNGRIPRGDYFWVTGVMQ